MMRHFIYCNGIYQSTTDFDLRILQGSAPTLTVEISDTAKDIKDQAALSNLAHELLLHINRVYKTTFDAFNPPIATKIENGGIKELTIQLFKNIHRL